MSTRDGPPPSILQLIYWLCFTISATLLLLGSTRTVFRLRSEISVSAFR
jgi:hypothetical protein